MSRVAFSQKLILESPQLVCVHFRSDVAATQQKRGEAILDVNHMGNWVRGVEMVGGFVPFSVAAAVSPFNPVLPTAGGIAEQATVTYDPQADAAFFYLEYDPAFARLAPSDQAELKVVSHCINPTASYGLDFCGGLVWIRIPFADVSLGDRFLALLRK